MNRHIIKSLILLCATLSAFAGPEEPPLYFAQVGTGNHPVGFAVYSERSYVFLGFDKFWLNIHWLWPSTLILAVVIVLTVWVAQKARKSEHARPANPTPPGTSAAEQPRVPGSGGG